MQTEKKIRENYDTCVKDGDDAKKRKQWTAAAIHFAQSLGFAQVLEDELLTTSAVANILDVTVQ